MLGRLYISRIGEVTVARNENLRVAKSRNHVGLGCFGEFRMGSWDVEDRRILSGFWPYMDGLTVLA